MHNKYKIIPVKEISMDELREKEDPEDETTFFEYKLGLFSEMDKEAIGFRADLWRLLKNGYFNQSEKKALIKKLDNNKLNPSERKAYQRAIKKLRKYFLH